MVGLDSSGETTILYELKLGETVRTIPTIGIHEYLPTLLINVMAFEFILVVAVATCLNQNHKITFILWLQKDLV